MTSVATVGSESALSELVTTVRRVVGMEVSPAETATLVQQGIEPLLRRPDLLPSRYRVADPTRYCQHVVHCEEDGSFSVVALVWLPGQETPIHDHIAWCVAGVCSGAESERRYELRGSGDQARLVPTVDVVNQEGTASAFAPPGDIHFVRNAGDSTVYSIHVYGANIDKLGTSVRRVYHLPIADS